MPKLLSQLDPRWTLTRIGGTSLTLGRWGCAVTSLLNGANAVGANKKGLLPSDLAHNASLFTASGDVIWDKACAFIGDVKFAGREQGENRFAIDAALKDPKQFVILQVNLGAHFVLGWNRSPFGTLRAGDPLGGTVVDVKKKYFDVVGERYFVKK